MSFNGQDELSFFSLKKEFDSYSLSTAKKDFLAALQVSLLTVPQAMAYSLVAGLPLSCGIFAAIFSAIVGTLLSSSPYLIFGPVNAIAILVQAGTAEILFTFYREAPPQEQEILALQIMTQIALVSGIFHVLAGIFKLGRLTQFVSQAVVVGYLTGAALAIVTNQIFTFSGMVPETPVDSIYEKWFYLFSHFKTVHLPTIIVGGGSLFLLIALKRLHKQVPAAAIMLIVAVTALYFVQNSPFEDWGIDIELVGWTAERYDLLPLISLPAFNSGIMGHILSISFAVALLSVIETTCTSKAVAANTRSKILTNQEIMASGFANLTSALTQSMPVSVSASRSFLNVDSGAITRVAALMNALLVGLIIHMLGFFVNRIPLASMSALLFVTAATQLNFRHILLCIKTTRADAFVLMMTFGSCIFFSLDMAFYIGVVISITLYLNKAALPRLVEYAVEDSGELKSLDPSQAYHQKKIRMIKVEGELFFGAADIFQTTLKAIVDDDAMTKVVILQLRNARDFDATSCMAFSQLHETMRLSGRHLIVCGMTQDVWIVMSNAGVIQEIGKENLFLFDDRYPHLHMQRAIKRAKELTEAMSRPPPVELIEEPEAVPVL